MKRKIIPIFGFVLLVCSFMIFDCNSFTMPGFDISTLGDVYGPRNVVMSMIGIMVLIFNLGTHIESLKP